MFDSLTVSIERDGVVQSVSFTYDEVDDSISMPYVLRVLGVRHV